MLDRLSAWGIVVVLAFTLATISRAEEPWHKTYATLSAQPGQARTAFEFLQRQPLEVKKTLAYHITLAKAAKAIGDPVAAARAVTIVNLVFHAGGSGDLTEVKTWLSERGLELHRLALEFLAAGDETTATKKYLGAVRCDQAVLGFDDRHLRDRASALIEGVLRDHPDSAESWATQAFFSYYFGHIDVAREALKKAITLQKDPYMVWVYQRGLQVVEAERPPASPEPGQPVVSPAPSPVARTPDPVAAQYAKDQQQLLQDALNRLDHDTAEATKPTTSAVSVSVNLQKVRENLELKKKFFQQAASELRSIARTSSNSGFRD